MTDGRRMVMVSVGAAVLVLAGCGRTHSDRRDAGARDSRADGEAMVPEVADALRGDGGLEAVDALVDAKPDVGYVLGDGKADVADVLAPEGKPDTADVGDGKADAADARLDLPTTDTAATDLPVPDLAGDPPDLAPLSCASLRPLVDKGVLTDRHVRNVLFAPDGKALLLQMMGGDGSASDDVMLVSLPGGERRTLATGIVAAEWLASDAVLLTTPDAGLRVVSLRGDLLHEIAGKSCSHAATPDGSLLYYTHDCGGSTGTASVLDLVSGASKQLDTSVYTSELVVSPGGRWTAYGVYSSATDASPSSTAVRVVEKDGTPYTVPTAEAARSPVFLSDEILLARSQSSDFLGVRLWRHRPGTGEANLLTEGDPGYPAFESNADRSGFLLAKFPSSSNEAGELHLASIADGSLVRLASDLIDYRMFASRFQAFAIARASQRVVYIALEADASYSYDVVSVAQDGKARVKLGANTASAVVSPYGDRVAVFNSNGSVDGNSVTVVSSTTGATQYAIDAITFLAVSFVPGDRGLLFADRENDSAKTWRLRHLSFTTGAVTTLAEWSTTKLLPYMEPTGLVTSSYPIDPTGCFVPVDSDLDPSGTRLVLLPE